MAITPIVIAGIGAGVAAYGTYQTYQSGKKMQQAQEEQAAIQQRQEANRQRQMELDATRRKREIIRQSIAARAGALAATTAAGASGGSALPGAYAGYSNRTNVNTLGVNQNLEIGREMFGLNSQLAGVYRDSAQASTGMAMGSALSSLGGAIMTNAGQISRVGQFTAGKMGFGFASPATRY